MCRGQIPPESPSRTAWRTDGPLLILGSHAWNIPDDKGRIYCDGKGQALVMHASTLRCDCTAAHCLMLKTGADLQCRTGCRA